MRTVLVGDIIAAARVLLLHPQERHAHLIAKMLDQSHAAHLYHKRFRRPHPVWGNGSLMARANTQCQSCEPYASDARYLKTLQTVISALLLR